MTLDQRVLIIGAGPVGLMLACLLASAGTPFRIVDSKGGTVEDSRALGVHARTLEIMQSLDLAEDFVRHGRVTRFMTFHEKNRALFSLDFNVLRDDTAYPFYLILPQSITEALLYDKLRSLGADVEWNTSLRSIEEDDDGVTAHFEKGTVRHATVVGCDGAGSIVRKSIGVAFSGLTYDARFVLSEVRIAEDRLATDATHVIMADESVVAAIPLPNGAYRLVGPDSMASRDLASGAPISFDAFADFLRRNELFPNTRMYDASRVVSYLMQKRVADSFVTQRVFLAGDAAHIHSPAGGQGMNMGIGDAANLAWRLSLAHRVPHTALLAPYGEERRGTALTIANGTDRALRVMNAPGMLYRFVFKVLAPIICRVWQPKKLIHAMAQLGIAYGNAGDSLAAGKRLPWVKTADGNDLYDLLQPGQFCLLHLASGNIKAPNADATALNEVRLEDNRFYRPGRQEDAITVRPIESGELGKLNHVARLLVRPDGYIAAVDRDAQDDAIASYLTALNHAENPQDG